MAVDFPNSPATNDTFSSNDKTFVWTGTRWNLQSYTASKGSFYTGDSAPGSPLTGDIWYDTSVGKTYMRYDSYWVEVGNSGTVRPTHGTAHINGAADAIDGDRLQIDYLPSTYARNSAASGATQVSDLTAHLGGVDSYLKRLQAASSAPSSPSTGWLWYDTSVSLLKVYNGSAWVTTALSGSVVQTVVRRSDVRTTYAANNSGNGTNVAELVLAITPKFASSTIICDWMINGEMHQDAVFLMHKDGSLVTASGNQGYNSAAGNARQSGMVSAFYDQNQDSTPSNWKLTYVDSTTLSTASRSYAPAVRGSGASNWTLALNHTLNGSNSDNYESMVSIGIAMEIAA